METGQVEVGPGQKRGKAVEQLGELEGQLARAYVPAWRLSDTDVKPIPEPKSEFGPYPTFVYLELKAVAGHPLLDKAVALPGINHVGLSGPPDVGAFERGGIKPGPDNPIPPPGSDAVLADGGATDGASVQGDGAAPSGDGVQPQADSGSGGDDDDGCGCVVGRPPKASAALWTLVLLLVIRRRRR